MNREYYRQAMENLEKKYLEAWRKADEEKKKTGKVSKATEMRLEQMEVELQILEEA